MCILILAIGVFIGSLGVTIFHRLNRKEHQNHDFGPYISPALMALDDMRELERRRQEIVRLTGIVDDCRLFMKRKAYSKTMPINLRKRLGL